jgi:Secretion system C-terminal sorting domain/Beta-propeller repeat
MKKLILTISCFCIAMIMNAQDANYVWAKQLGENVTKQFVDASGNNYSIGTFTGTTDFDPSAGTANLVTTQAKALYVCKLDAAGNYIWAKKIAETSSDFYRASISIDASGNVFTTGAINDSASFNGTVFIANGTSDIFINKLDATGNFVWTKTIGGSLDDYASAISTDATGNFYITGGFNGTVDFDANAGVTSFTSNGKSDIFIAKYSSLGNLIWARQIGGIEDDYANSINIDIDGNVYTIGDFGDDADFDPDTGTAILTVQSTVVRFTFISKLDAAGNYVWAKKMGGGSSLSIPTSAITTDANGAVYATGSFFGLTGFGTQLLVNFSAEAVIFICKLDSTGVFSWAKAIGGIAGASGMAIIVDNSFNIYTTGIFHGTVDFDPGVGTVNLVEATSLWNDYYLNKMDSSGKHIWVKQFKVGNSAKPNSINLDNNNNIYFAGNYGGVVDFDPNAGVANLGGFNSGFACKLTQAPLGVNDITAKLNYSIFPNPNNGNFTIRISDNLQNANVKVYSILGELVYNAKVVGELTTLNANLKAGLYFLSVENKNQKSIQKIIVE